MPARRIPLAIFTFVALLIVAPPRTASAADPSPPETALSKVPADAEFFRSTLRLGETIEIIGKSRAWQQLWNEPAVQAVWKKALASFEAGDGDFAAIKKFFNDPANKELPALAADAVSNEIFLYAGAGTGDSLALLQELVGSARFGPAIQQLLNQNMGGDPTRARIRLILQSLAEKPERLRVPDLVIGFKVSEPAKVTAQLKRLDPLLAGVLKDTPLKDRAKRVTVAGDEFLVLELDGSLVPWDMLPLGMFEEKEGEFNPLIKHLKGMKLSITVGVRQGYLLVAIGESTASVAKFGGNGPMLAGRPEMKPLAKAAGKPLTTVGYTSAKLRQATATTPEDITNWADVAKTLLDKADLPDDLRKPLEKDIEGLTRAIAKGLQKPGAAMNFSVRTPRGWETFDYDYSPSEAGEPKPLTLLNHLGGDPLLASVWRSGTTIDDYKSLVKWVAVFAGHAEKIALSKSPDAEPFIKAYRKDVLPLLQELSDITEKLWLPALADGQEGIVLDAKWASKMWHASLQSDKALPLPELGIIVGVSDSAKLEQALEGYRKTINKMIAKARELDPSGSIPEFEIPKPKVESKGGRTFAFYPIPEEWGIDKQFQPTGGLSPKLAVLTLSRSHAERLLTETPFKTGLSPFADTTRPLDSAFYFNWAGFVDMAAPWVGYVTRKAMPDGDRDDVEKMAAKVMGFLRVFRSYGSVTYREAGATITHSEAVFRDIDAPK